MVKTVFTNGCFDMVHAGHVRMLRYARSIGDYLIVGLNSDESVRRIKGEGRPVQSQEDRMYCLKAFPFVDDVVIFEEDTEYNLITRVKPDIVVKGSEWRGKLEEGIHIPIGTEVSFYEICDNKLSSSDYIYKYGAD